ncbi:cyclin-D2-1-like [Cucurbita pepo subsp. pepo]|uniref:cyclin-D2-1-like n=1 Tax=Cucurbita pepo subsp. pepo TaxID=3664 RepID=UPI000C9D448B|nr:cyclin-D2-1-like [Cucurbita pepo subsp. pepo]
MSLSPDQSPASSSSSGPARHVSADLLCSTAADSLISDDSAIFSLLQSELDHMPRRDYVRRCRDRSIDVIARQDSINWILKVHAHYNFKPVTAILSVNYFDRFLSANFLPRRNGWPFQLLAVACLSLAAKMEEPLVPLLLDLQIFEPKYVFDPKTVQRMELRVLSILNWRLRVVTPFDFLHHFISDLPPSSAADGGEGDGDVSRCLLFSTSSDLILSTTRVIDFLGFPPCTIAAAAVLTAAGERVDSPAVCTHFLAANRVEMVRSCYQLMEEYIIDTCPADLPKQRSRGVEQPAPTSPVGVLEAAACGSCDTEAAVEPPTKRLRSSAPDVQEQ